MKIGPVVLAENRLTDGNCTATRLPFDDSRPFISNYWTDLRQPFLFHGDYTSGSAMAEGPRDALVSRNSATTKHPI